VGNVNDAIETFEAVAGIIEKVVEEYDKPEDERSFPLSFKVNAPELSLAGSELLKYNFKVKVEPIANDDENATLVVDVK